MRTPIVFGLAAALLFVSAMLVTPAPANAQNAPGGSAKPKAALKDVTDSVGDKPLKILAGIQAGDLLSYSIGYHGEATVTSGAATASTKSTSSQHLDFTIRKSAKDGEPMDVEAKCTLISFTTESQSSGEARGRVLSFMVRTDGDDGNGLFIDGLEETSPPKGMPTAATVKTNMSGAVAFGRIGKDHQSLSRPSHAARFTDTAEENIAQNLLDPVTAMRLIFAGYAGREVKVGETITFDTMLSTDTAGSAPAGYSVTMKAVKALGADKEAEVIAFTFSAVPKDGATMDLGSGVKAKPPVLAGDALVEIKRGIVLLLSVSGTYDGEGASGSIHMRADLTEKK